MGHNLLFRNFELDGYLNQQKRNIIYKIQNEDKQYLANVNIEEYLEYIQATYEINLPIIDENNISIEKQECKVERYDHFDAILRHVDGVAIKIYIPFYGDSNIFLARANTYSSMAPIGEIINNNIVITIGLSMSEIEEYKLEQGINDNLNNIKKHLEYAQKDLENYNKSIKSIAKTEIDYILDNYNKVNKLLENIPYKIRRNESIPTTFKIPNVVKKVEIKKPNLKNIVQEPELDSQEYDNIIQICSDMATVIERSPKSFATMKEEDLRTHFLVQLNGHYQGQATGETFNSNGKTDILIRSNNQNVFIAECKFWHGVKAFLSTIDQLLGYVTYRDTKTAIFVFVKNQDFTSTFEDMKTSIQNHPNFIKFDASYKSPNNTSTFRCQFMNFNDTNKHFYITVMAFCMPNFDKK